ncbi:Site-specific recombinase XerC [Roseivivax halotolerans]|uniref:Site-specific recombinase XerC n=1 Tax=Roseivivax halotolerans TaxID=93684 RepID=A0A1I6ACX1_9RHOB|nr:tyrosine-type recombinase/integrase [Roseivivax halotolerans]SFQ66515.1 Site-specific recombinase XerC [Roseivivax halotolerans]
MVKGAEGKRYLHEPKPGFIYVRKGGKYLGRIKAAPGTPDFDREYWEILTGKTHAAKTSWSALIASYRASDRWLNLKPSTRSTYERVLVYILEKNGRKDMTRLHRKDVIAAQNANRHKPKFANDIPAIMSVLCEHAIDIGWISANPAKGVRKMPIPKERQRPHVPWTDEAVATFRAEANHRARLIFEIGIGSVQRPADWVKFNWGDYDGRNLSLSQSKTSKSLVLPCDDNLKAALASEIERLGVTPHPSRPILIGEHGHRLTKSGMGQIMRRERRRLGLMVHDQHALRYRGVMELAWAGCDDDEIMSYSGHDTKEMVIKYAGLARQIMRATTAAEKRRLWAST